MVCHGGGIKMQFTKEELTIIERMIDNHCMDHQKGIGQHLSGNKIDIKKAREFVNKHWDSWSKAYDKLRTISAKCSKMKGEVK